MMRLLGKFARETRGVAAIEFALIVPFVILVYLGLFDLTTLITVNRKVTYSTSVVADLVTQNNTNVLQAQITDYYNAAEMVMDPVPMSDVRVEVYGYRLVAGAVNQIWSVNNGQGSGCGAPSTADLDDLMLGGNDMVIAQVCTDFTPRTAMFLGEYLLGAPNFTVSQQIAQRPRQVGNATLTCFVSSVGGATC
ncbi:MAG: pilus assembly protein [Rhizobiales bacterium]|nr:pilus assembly protein [Hyphomicrobiales bacterium]